MSERGSWLRGASWTRSLKHGTTYRGGRTRLGRRRVAQPEWPFLVMVLLVAGAMVIFVLGAFVF